MIMSFVGMASTGLAWGVLIVWRSPSPLPAIHAKPRLDHAVVVTREEGPSRAITRFVQAFPANAPDVPVYPEHQDLSYYLDPAGNHRPINSAKDWEIRRRHVLAHLQRVMGDVPSEDRRVPLNVEYTVTKRVGDVTRHLITFQSEPGDRVPAYLFLPGKAADDGNPPKRRAAMLCLHQTIPIGKEEPAGLGSNPDLDYAAELAELGFVTLAPDYPSFGEHAFDFGDARFGYASGSMKAIWDNMRALDLLQSLPEVDAERIGCIGHSLGGHNGLFTACFDPRIKVVVTNCGFTRFHKYYDGDLTGWTSERYMPRIESEFGHDPNRVPFDFSEILAAIAPRSVLVCAPVNDINFELSGVKEAVDSARPIFARLGDAEALQAEYPNCGHEFPPNMRKLAYRFLKERLGESP